VSVHAAILNLLVDLRAQEGAACVVTAHDPADGRARRG
jgi:ABC-type oligopeptide transport system ATPase subunit